MVGELLRRRKLRPDVLLSSPAERAKETARLVCDAAGLSTTVRYEAGIYEASARRLLEIVSEIEDERSVAMMVGHNPGFEELLEVLTGETRRLPTAALALIELGIERWREVGPGTGRLEWLVKPKELK